MFSILSTCKGGGYMYARTTPRHPKANKKGLYPLHRVIMENKLGRLLNDNEDVHHINEDKTDNSESNLEVMTRSAHAAHHAKRVADIKVICPKCQKEFFVKPNFHRLRLKRNKKGKIFCSRSCAASK